MKKNELDMAIRILQRVEQRYDSFFDEDGKVKSWTDRSESKTAAAQEIRFARRLLLEVSKEL